MKTLPYFRWYPADAETDEAYSSLTDAELGLFHRCLNRAWINDGLPSDLGELSRVMKTTREELDRVWPRLSKMFLARASNSDRLENPRQEEERSYAIAKGEANKRPGNANASREKRERVPAAIPSERDGITTRAGAKRAYDSVSVSTTTDNIQSKDKEKPSERFEELWSMWPRKTGREQAERDWFSLVTIANEELVFSCAARYLGSAEVSRSVVRNLGSVYNGGGAKTGWIVDCCRDGWSCDWPMANESPPGKLSKREETLKRLAAVRATEEFEPDEEDCQKH